MIAPRDAGIYAAQDFAFAEINQDAVSALLGRPLPDGGGDTFENVTSTGGPEARAWIQVVGLFLNGGAPGLQSAAGGVEAGADAAVGSGGRLGAALGYEGANVSDSAGGSGSQTIFRVSGYGSQAFGGVVLSAAVSYAHGWDNTDRASGFGPSTTSRGSDAVTGAAQRAAPFDAGGLKVTPAVGVLISSLTGGSFTEHNAVDAGFAVTGSETSLTAVSPFATVGLSHAFVGGDGLAITPDVQLGYRYDGAGAGRVTLVAEDGTLFAGNRIDPNPNAPRCW